MITIYGIKNCDTCRKALKWLETEGIDHTFHDFRKDGLEESVVANWLGEIGIETLLNKRGTTWRKLSEEEQTAAGDDRAAALLTENPTLIKRPVFDLGSSRRVGFASDTQEALKAAQ